MGGGVFYSYLKKEIVGARPKYITSGGYNYYSLFVMDEEYKLIDTVPFMKKGESIQEDWQLEGHDYIILGKGHYLLMSYIPTYVNNLPDSLSHPQFGTRVLATVLQEIKDGQLVWEWNSTDCPELYEMSVESNDWYNQILQWNDYVHMNSITVDPNDGDIVCSCRHLNSVFKIDKETKEIKWVLGGIADEFGLTEKQKFKRQHFARYTETGELTLFDNQTSYISSKFPESSSDVGTGIPRVLRMRLNEDEKRIEEYSEFSLNRSTAEFMGSAMLIDSETNTFLIGWGGSSRANTPAIFTEVDFENFRILCEAIPAGNDRFQTYRVYKFAK